MSNPASGILEEVETALQKLQDDASYFVDRGIGKFCATTVNMQVNSVLRLVRELKSCNDPHTEQETAQLRIENAELKKKLVDAHLAIEALEEDRDFWKRTWKWTE